MNSSSRRWWHDTAGYEVYLPSFKDSDGDGIGDLPGLLEHLDYLAWLGVDVLWVTPFYPSPMRDHGYDVADYLDVDPVFGRLDHVDTLVRRAHDHGMRVAIDLVPNHTSSDHSWFRRARSSPDDPYRDYYLWRDPAPDGGPPNNWRSHFGGPAWTLDEGTGQYWCHLFLPEQPDLNWANPKVRQEFDAILRFWLERGVDGFRIDVAHALAKHPEFPDLPPAPRHLADGPVELTEYELLDHVYDVDQQPEVLEIYQRWRRIAEKYDALLLGEVYLLDIARFAPYVADQDGLHLAFWFRPLHVDWDPPALRRVLAEAVDAAGAGVAWVQGSHDRARAATRFGGGEVGRRRSLAFATLLIGLPGMPVLYQGEELGLVDGRVPEGRARDPIGVRAGDFAHSRDGCRTPMMWQPGPGWGFTEAEEAWLPFGDRTKEDTVSAQRDDPDSMLQRFRALLRVRREQEDLRHGPFEWLAGAPDVLAYRRGAAVVAANCGEERQRWTLPDGMWRVVFATRRSAEDMRLERHCPLDAGEAVVLVRAQTVMRRGNTPPGGQDRRRRTQEGQQWSRTTINCFPTAPSKPWRSTAPPVAGEGWSEPCGCSPRR